MFCPKCGLNLSGLDACPKCHPVSVPEDDAHNSVDNVHAPGTYIACDVQKNEHEGYAIAALVCGILSFFGGGLVTGIIAWVFGDKYRKTGEVSKLQMANAGRILGIISVALCGVAFLVYLCVFMWMFMATALSYGTGMI